MKTPKWFCKICQQTLTRKWNAKRHCFIKHDGLFESIIMFSDYFKMTNSNTSPHQKTRFFYDNSTIPNIQPYGQKTQDKENDFTQREVLLSNTLDRIAPKYDEIQNLLLSEPDKKTMLGSIICRAVYDDNPLGFINKQIKELRKKKLHNLMLEDVSLFLGFNKQLTKEYLKMGLKEDSIE